MKNYNTIKYLAILVMVSPSVHSSTFEQIPLTEYSCKPNGQTVKWNDTSSWFSLAAITNTIFKRGCKYAQRQIRGSYIDDVEVIRGSLDLSILPGPIGCQSRSEVPMSVVGSHMPTSENWFIPTQINFKADTYTISANTPYELHQKDQSKRGTNRLDKWYSQWIISPSDPSFGNEKAPNVINGRKNGHSNTGPMTFSIDNNPKTYQVLSNMSRGTREYSFSIGGSIGSDFTGNINMDWPSAKINGEKCYATTLYKIKVERNAKPTIHSIVKNASNLTASATDKHTADSYLSYTWEVTDINNRKHYKTGKTISLSGISGNYYSAIVTVSDGNMSSSLKKIFETAPPRPIDVRPCPTCQIP
ncbi:hypothetical protein HRH59_11170 [Rheinheimera sp. YQF-2]|uniref:PKD domain-containing protein n=1 Tax=Rheinheimera lutimaris TaxID=2740584 RepID=A0A7Y5ARB5_9GAMM|nr:hypothetical protein [Rheinheimera lutimaris]NRQ43102.1 hypothetical protein [Rheinheimera lutimaris]